MIGWGETVGVKMLQCEMLTDSEQHTNHDLDKA